MEMLSSEYGWTPNEISSQPMEMLEAYIEIISTKRLIEKNNSKRNVR